MMEEIEMLQSHGALSEDNNLNEKDVITSSKKIMRALKSSFVSNMKDARKK